MQLTVKQLRDHLADKPDDMEVVVDFETRYDGHYDAKSGPADDCLIIHQGQLVITGWDRAVDWKRQGRF